MKCYDEIKKKIQDINVPFQEIGTAKYEMNGISTETILLEYENTQFVYVPGKKDVVLGWDTEKCGLGEGVQTALKEYFQEGKEYFEGQRQDLEEDYQEQIREAEKQGEKETVLKLKKELKDELEFLEEQDFSSFSIFLNQWNKNLKACLSPLRKADIGPMLVETDCRPLERMLSYEDFCERLKKTPFCLPTEDEWEYLCNGGTRTLFRWGDSLKEELNEMFRVGCGEENTFRLLTRPNMFGLFIAYDSYQYELIDHPVYVKGGDGGCSLCGGDGIIYVAPCFTAFHRQKKGKLLSSDYHFYRRIIRL